MEDRKRVSDVVSSKWYYFLSMAVFSSSSGGGVTLRCLQGKPLLSCPGRPSFCHLRQGRNTGYSLSKSAPPGRGPHVVTLGPRHSPDTPMKKRIKLKSTFLFEETPGFC